MKGVIYDKSSLSLIEGIIWSALWIVTVSVVIQRYPWLIEHDYPKDVREAGDYSSKNPAQKKEGTIFSVTSFTLLMLLLMLAGILHYQGTNASFFTIWLHLWIICMTWNLVDLVILDWIMICVYEAKYVILPGSKGCKGNKDYFFHFIGFIKGFVVMTLISLIFAGVDYLIIRFWIG